MSIRGFLGLDTVDAVIADFNKVKTRLEILALDKYAEASRLQDAATAAQLEADRADRIAVHFSTLLA